MNFNLNYLIFFFLLGFKLIGQQGAPSCAELEANYKLYQSCATNIPFTNSVGGNAETFNTTCIPTSFVGPTWFFVEIKTPGNVILQISQVNNSGQGRDVDFVLWGPFRNLNNICSQLNTSTEANCSYSAAAIETVSIPNSVTGDLYVLLIDNFSGEPGTISVTQTGGSGTTNCDFLSSVKIKDVNSNDITQLDYCKPDTKELKAVIDITDFSGAPANLRFNYTWTRNGVVVSTLSNSTDSTNNLLVSDSGLYKVAVTAYDITTNPTGNTTGLRVSEAEIDLKFHLTPQVSIVNTNSICLDTSPVLNTNITNQSSLNNTIDVLSYQWYLNNISINGAISSTYTPTQPGDYFVRVTNSPCSVVTSNTIRIVANPVVSISANTILCENDSFTITSSITNTNQLSNITYQWYKDGNLITGANNSTYTVNKLNQALNTTSNYYLEVKEQGLCLKKSNSISVTINALPIVNTLPIKLEQCDYLNSTIDGIAETNLAQTQIVNHMTNNVQGMTLYYYYDSALTQPISNFQNYINTSSPFNQNIYVKLVNENVTPNCTALGYGTLQLQINPTSVANYPDISPVCPQLNQNYGFIDFNAQRAIIKNNFFPSSNVTISFHLSASEASTGLNPLSNTSQIPFGTTLIHTRVFSPTTNKCEGVGTFNVVVIVPPLLNVISKVNICDSETFTPSIKDQEALLNQNASVTLSYFNSFDDAKNNFGALNPNIAIDTNVGNRTFFIRLYDNNTQCFSIVNFVVQTFPNPTIFSPTPIKHCGMQTATFDLTSRIRQITGGNTNLRVSFYETQSDFDNNIAISPQNNYLSTTKTLIVKVVDPQNNNCYKTTRLDLVVLSLPGLDRNPTPIELCNDSGYEIFNLRSRELEMAANDNFSSIEFKFYNDINDALANNNDYITNTTAYKNLTVNEETIYVRLNSKVNFDSESSEACYRILELKLFVRKYPENFLIKDPYVICIDKNNQVVYPAEVDTKLDVSTYTFVWYNGFNAVVGNEIPNQNNSSLLVTQAGEYSVKITNVSNAANCTSIFNFTTFTSKVPDNVSVTPQELIAFGIDNVVTALALPQSNDYEYSVDGYAWQTSPEFKNLMGGAYKIQVRNKYGCGTAENNFYVVEFPKYLTPNNDGFHDTWNVRGVQFLESIKILIFNRYGKLIKEIDPNGSGWDGNYNGEPQPADDYWFKLIYVNNGVEKEYKSHFALKR